MARIGELFFIMASITTIATFFGARALARRFVRTFGRKPKDRPSDQRWDEHNERRTHEGNPDSDVRR